MAKTRSITLSVPQPCHEDWDNMTPNERGRHCDNCNKTVVDFSLYSDRELVDFLKQGKGDGCGRFNAYQIDRPLQLTEKPNHSVLHRILCSTVLTAWLTGNAVGQNPTNRPATEQHIQLNKKHQDNSTPKEQKDSEKVSDSTHYIEGTVIQNNGSRLFQSVFVHLKNCDSQTRTDSNGRFKLFIPDNLVGKKVILYFDSYRHRHKLKIKAVNFPVVINKPIKVKGFVLMGKF